MSQMLMNPKFLTKAAYLMILGFAAFHFTRLTLAIFTGALMARFGKP